MSKCTPRLADKRIQFKLVSSASRAKSTWFTSRTRQVESLVEQCQVESSQLVEQWQTKHILAFKVYILSTAWSTKVRSACCQPMTEGHNRHTDYLSVILFCHGWAARTKHVCAASSWMGMHSCSCQYIPNTHPHPHSPLHTPPPLPHIHTPSHTHTHPHTYYCIFQTYFA